MLLVKALITLLCAVGFYASVFMWRKHERARHGEVRGPSVVKTKRAKLYFGIPNAAFGTFYYLGIAIIAWTARAPVLLASAQTAAVLAAATSLYLAYSLLFVTKRSCPFCWTSHAVNLCLLFLVPWLWLLR